MPITNFMRGDISNIESKYLYSLKNDKALMLWPKKSVEVYLTKPYLPQQAIAGNETVVVPPRLKYEPLNKYGIDYAAQTTHDVSYICDRVNREFSTIIYTYSGKAQFKCGNKNYLLRKGDVLLMPIGSNSTISVEKSWQIIWFHLDSSWRFAGGKTPIVGQGKRVNEIKLAVQLYRQERYKTNPSVEILDFVAKIIETYLSLQFSKLSCMNIDKIPMEAINKKGLTTKKLAEELKTTPYFINKKFHASNCKSFANLRRENKMKRAKELLLKHKVKVVAKELDYSGSQVFSRAFKTFFKISPRDYLKEISGRNNRV